MREKRVSVWIFKINISSFTKTTGHIVEAILTLDNSNDVFLRPLVPFGVVTIPDLFYGLSSAGFYFNWNA